MSDLDPDEALAMEREADRLARDRRAAELSSRMDRVLVLMDLHADERRHTDLMARLDRIAAALEKL